MKQRKWLSRACATVTASLVSLIMASGAMASGDFYTINSNNLGKISLTGQITKTGTASAGYTAVNLAYNTADGNFYTIYNRSFAKITPTGQTTEICEIQVSASDLDEFVDLCYNTSDGNFYALNANHLTKITPAGVFTEVCDLGVPISDYFKFERLCYNSADGNFYALNYNHLCKITPSGQTTEICDLGMPCMDYDVFRGLCYNASDGNLYSLNFNHLIKITTTGVITEICDLQVDGIDFLYPDNIAWVPAASNNPDHYSIGGIKKLSESTPVAVDDAVVTAINIEPGVAYVESSNRTSGIKLHTTRQLAIGQRIKFNGIADKIDGEFQISNPEFSADTTNGDPLAALGMNSGCFPTATIGDTAQKGVVNSGLLVRYAGKVNSSNPTDRLIFVDDGGNAKNDLVPGSHGIMVRIPAGVTMPQDGDIIVITGISRVEKRILPAGGGLVNGVSYPAGTAVYIPCVWPRDASDIRVIAP